MKVKKFNKKLYLSKETIANLSFKNMDRINGGLTPRCTFPDCSETCPDYTACSCGCNPTAETCQGKTCDPPCP
jgi:hypothetical protein